MSEKPTSDTTFVVRQPKQVNLNTIVSLASVFLTAFLSVIGWALKEQVSDMKNSMTEIKISVMPKQEIEARLETVRANTEENKKDNNQLRSDTLELRRRIQELEIEVARIPKRPLMSRPDPNQP